MAEPDHLRAPAGRRGRTGEAAGAPGLAGAGDLGGGAGAALRLARPPGGRRRGRSLPLRRPRACCARGPLLVALDQVQDPRNLGAVCRSAEFAGAAGVIVPERRSAAVTAVTCKASAGRSSTLRSPTSATSPTGSPRPRRPASGSGAPTPRPSGALVGRPQRPDRPRPRRRGQGPPPAGRRRLRRPARLPPARQDRLPERLRRGGRAALRGPAPAAMSPQDDRGNMQRRLQKVAIWG